MQARRLRYQHRRGYSQDLDAREQDAVDRACRAFREREAPGNRDYGREPNDQNAQQHDRQNAQAQRAESYKALFARAPGSQ